MEKNQSNADHVNLRIRRSLPGPFGPASNVDPTIKSHLDELNKLLGKGYVAPITKPQLEALLKKPLTPKFIPAKAIGGAQHTWAANNILTDLFARDNTENTISDYVQRTPEISILKSQFLQKLKDILPDVDPNVKEILNPKGFGAIFDYLVVYAYSVGKRTEVNGLADFILNDDDGVKNVANYAIVSATREMIDKGKLIVDKYNEDDQEFVKTLKKASISIEDGAFSAGAKKVIDNVVFNAQETQLIKAFEAVVGDVPDDIEALLVKYIRNSTIKITPQNVNYFLPLFITQILGTQRLSDVTEVDHEEADKDFEVTFPQDDPATIQVSKSSVKCAAQLYYNMVLGDELEVFNVVNYFNNKYLIRGGIEIQDSRLRDDLQMYVFSNKFTDPKTRRVLERTRPAERQMFYKQVFNAGNAQAASDMVLNKEFPKLWKMLILESAKYLEREQESLKEDYVPRQNVIQAVEDLQYNLSTHCTGMANVISPLINAELDFVMSKIFNHPEILRQVSPARGTWWRVVETLYMEMKNYRPKTTVFINKAKLGNMIINSIADYKNAEQFGLDTTFNPFVGNVDAFITSQSILLEETTANLIKENEEPKQPEWVKNVVESVGAATAGANGATNEWDF